MENKRKCEIYKDNQWVEIEFKNIKENNIFRLSEPTGETVLNDNDDSIFKAQSDACLNNDKIWEVTCFPASEED